MTTIKYRLPKTELVVTGTVRTVIDKVGKGQGETRDHSLLGVDVSLQVVADSDELTLKPPTGCLSTYKGSFGLMNDGRLSSASHDSTGELGTVLKSVASIAGTAVAIGVLSGSTPATDQHALRSYIQAHRDSGEKLRDLRAARHRTVTALQERLVPVEGGPDLGELRTLRTIIGYLDERLVPLEAAFQAWRASKVTTTDSRFELRVDPVRIPVSDPEGGGTATGDGLGVPVDLDDLWARFGVGVVASWPGQTDEPETQPSPSGDKTVFTRRPRLLELRVVKQEPIGVVDTSIGRHYIVDDRSELEAFELKSSWFGRRSVSLVFDSNGFLTTIGTEGSSAVAAAASGFASMPEAFAGGIETGTKAYTAWQNAGRASLDAELARVKANVELRQQRLVSAGLDATAGDAVELQRLQQLQGILESQTKIRGSNPGLVTELMSGAGDDLAWYTPPQASPPEPQVIQVVFGDGTAGAAPATPPVVPGGALGSEPGSPPA